MWEKVEREKEQPAKHIFLRSPPSHVEAVTKHVARPRDTGKYTFTTTSISVRVPILIKEPVGSKHGSQRMYAPNVSALVRKHLLTCVVSSHSAEVHRRRLDGCVQSWYARQYMLLNAVPFLTV